MDSKKSTLLAIYIFFVIIIPLKSNGQGDPMYSQYMFNIQAFNPAYTGSWRSFGLTLLAREQWYGFENNPETQTISFQAPLFKNTMGLGFSLINDKIGIENRQALFADYSFGFRVVKNVMLRFGIKGGITRYSNTFSNYVLIDPDDDSFNNDLLNVNLPNFGVGAFLHSEKLYLGFSVPRLIQNEIGNYSNNENIEFRHFTFIGGAVLPLFNGFDLKPSFNARYSLNEPLVADFNVSILLAKRFWIGAMFRTADDLGIGFNTNFVLGKNLRIGYAYDLNKNSGLSSYSSGTHEIMLSYEFHFEKTLYVSPRYF